MRLQLLAAPLLALATLSPAAAQTAPAVLKAKAGKPFVHKPSGMTLPAQLSGLPRGPGQEYAAPQLDIAFRYIAADQSEEISVYVYRATAGVPAVWFDAALRSVEARQNFGRFTRVDMPAPFIPPGQAAASGLRAGWTLSNGPYRSTALGIVPVGEWLVKLRFSSASSEAASLLWRLESAIAGLGWPAGAAAGIAALPVNECATPLKLSGDSKAAVEDGAAALLGALGVAAAGEAKKEAVVAQWCRDAAIKSPVPIYRPVGSDDRYLGSLSDSGHALWVSPSMTALLPGKAPSWGVSIVHAGETINFANRDRLPPPAQLNDIVRGTVTSRVTTWGKKRGITLDPAQFK